MQAAVSHVSEGLGFRDITPTLENQMAKNMENEMDTEIM